MRKRIGIFVGALGVAIIATYHGLRAPPDGPAESLSLAIPAPARNDVSGPPGLSDPDQIPWARIMPQPAASPAVLSQGEIAIWRGRLPQTLRSLAPDDAHPHGFDEGRNLLVPINDHEHIAVRLTRYDDKGPTAGVFHGEVTGAPGSTVVLSYVGDSQAGVIYVPAAGRSYVLSGGADGVVRVTTNDLASAPGCPPDPPRPSPPTS
jgi:hypothetical protein